MRFTQLFTKTKKQKPKDEVSKNAQLLIQGGFIYKEMAGVYTILPLGLRVLNKIVNILREEIIAIGGQEVQLTALQDKNLWEQTNRWSDDIVDVWFKTQLKNGNEIGLGLTHEEPLTRIAKEYISSYKDLPKYVFQIQNKFRNEIRAKSGILRGREFLMKDLYSFNRDEKEQDVFYNECIKAYTKYFERIGLGNDTYLTFASGGIFSKYSHEFQTLINAGEDTIYLDRDKKLAINDEVYTDEVIKELGLDKDKLEKVTAVEVGNIFKLGTKFSDALGLTYTNENGVQKPVIMGSYGIGPGRSMGTVVEVHNDKNGIIWPENIAPYKVHLVGLNLEDSNVLNEVESFYNKLIQNDIEVIFDDRVDITTGEKLADADLIGCPYRLIVSKKTSGKVEVKKRNENNSEIVSKDAALSTLKSKR